MKRSRTWSARRSGLAGALAAVGAPPAEHPEGKLVEAVRTVRLEVIEERDPAPPFLNAFHVVTRSYVIEREVLLLRVLVYDRNLTARADVSVEAEPLDQLEREVAPK